MGRLWPCAFFFKPFLPQRMRLCTPSFGFPVLLLSLLSSWTCWAARAPESKHVQLLTACSEGNKEKVKKLCEEGQIKESINRCGGIHHETPLHRAVGGGNLSIMAILLLHGAQWDKKDRFGHTALGYASTLPDPRAYTLLREVNKEVVAGGNQLTQGVISRLEVLAEKDQADWPQDIAAFWRTRPLPEPWPSPPCPRGEEDEAKQEEETKEEPEEEKKAGRRPAVFFLACLPAFLVLLMDLLQEALWGEDQEEELLIDPPAQVGKKEGQEEPAIEEIDTHVEEGEIQGEGGWEAPCSEAQEEPLVELISVEEEAQEQAPLGLTIEMEKKAHVL